MELLITMIAIMVALWFIVIYIDAPTKRYLDRFDEDKQAKIREKQERIDRDDKLKDEQERIDRENKLKDEQERIDRDNKLKDEQRKIDRDNKLKEEQERIDRENKLKDEQRKIDRDIFLKSREKTVTENKIREKIYKEKLEKERIEIENAKKSLTVLETAEIARAALKKLRISDLKDLIPFVHTEEQLDELISDFHNELLPVYEEIMLSYGIKKNLIGNKRFSELLEYCLEFGKTAIRKIPEINLEHKPLDERTLKSESATKEREIKKVASWAEIKKKIDAEK